MKTKEKKTGYKDGKLSASLEDYLEAVYRCSSKNGVARVSQIANDLGVGKSSVTAALKALAEKNYVNYDPYQFITLTEKGKLAASGIVRKHGILKKFLIDVLGIEEKQANENACKMEHVMDDDVLDRICCFVRYLDDKRVKGKKFSELFDDFCSRSGLKRECDECSGLEVQH